MTRRLLDLLTALSLLLCMAACVLWVRSHFLSDSIEYCYYPPPDGAGVVHGIESFLDAGKGRIALKVVPREYIPDRRPVTWRELPELSSGWQWETDEPYDPSGPAFLRDRRSWGGFGFDRHEGMAADGPYEEYWVSAPLWVFVLTFALPPAIRLRRRYRERNARRRGLCVACGYDLTGNASGVCPECGQVA